MASLANPAGTSRPPLPVNDIPTCTAQVGQEVLKDLVRLIIKKHLQSSQQLELHTITIDDGQAKTSRTFGAGKVGEKEETIPPDFLAIEDELRRLKDLGFPPDGKPCRLAPPI